MAYQETAEGHHEHHHVNYMAIFIAFFCALYFLDQFVLSVALPWPWLAIIL